MGAAPPIQLPRFNLVVADQSSSMSETMYFIVEFVDGSRRRWDRYMLGRLDEIGPMPTFASRRRWWRGQSWYSPMT
jgi:hypothetical protein